MALRRYWLVPAALAVVMLGAFVIAEALKVPLLTDPRPLLDSPVAIAATVGVALLVADVFLPVPSSAVMVAHGAAFGIAVGFALSLLGSLGAFAVAFALGRRGTGVFARYVPENELRRADQRLRRWGALAIVVTRPVPVLAETTAILAGASKLSWRAGFVAALVGSLPAAALYAVAGATADSFASGTVVFAVVIALGVVAAVMAPKACHEDAPVMGR